MSLESISNIAIIVSALVGICGIIFSCYKFAVKVKNDRSQYISSFLLNIEKHQGTFQIFDYSKNWYTKEFRNSELEEKIDSYLLYINYVLYCQKAGMITEKEARFFSYYVNRTIFSQSTINYLFNLYHFTQRQNNLFDSTENNALNIPFIFQDILDYAKQKGAIDEDFYNVESQNYPHILNID